MTPLEKFLEPIEIADQPLDGEYNKAYRMDGVSAEKPDMRLEIGLGTCHCCDYFTPRGGDVILIEETRLIKTIRNYEEEYDAMIPAAQKEKFFNRRICNENTLKAYGSLLVLWRWSAEYKEISESIGGKQHNFWFVASDSDVETGNNEIAFDSIRDQLLQSLRSTLGKTIIGDVKILTPDQLKSMLVKKPSTCL